MNINRVRRIVKAQWGLTTSSFFPNQDLTYWDGNKIAFKDPNLLWLNLMASTLSFGNPFMKSNGVPTEGKPNISLDAEYAGRPGMLKLLQLHRLGISNTADAVAAVKDPEKAARLLATGKADIVDGLVKKKPLISKELLGKIGGFISLGISFAGNFILPDFSGKYGSTSQAVRGLGDMVLGKNPYWQGAKFASDLITEIGGDTFKTDITNNYDAVAQALPGISLINGLGGKRTQDFSMDRRLIGKVGGAYTGTIKLGLEAEEIANKKIGLAGIAAGELGKNNKLIRNTKTKIGKVENIANEASDMFALGSNMSDLNHIRYENTINGALDLRYIRTTKLGGTLKRVKKINFHKIGGEIIKEWVPEIVDPIEVLLKGGNITNKLAILDLFKDYDLSNINIIDSLSPRVEGDNIYVNTDEDLIHELHHYTSQNKPNELYKDFYSDLNDDKITKLGGNLEFVSRTGDPSDFYAPAELEARLRAAKYKSSGLNYTKDFFKLLRTDENKYGYNMRDLLYMFNDENLEKLFNLKKSESFKEGGNIEWKPTIILLEGGKTRTLDELIEYAKLLNPRFILRLSEPLRYIRLNFKNDKGEDGWYHATHEMTHRDNIVYPMIQEVEGKLKRFENEDEAYNNAVNNNNILKFNSTEEAELFSKSGEDELGNLFGYKKGWANFFKQDPTKIKAESELNLFKEGGKTDWESFKDSPLYKEYELRLKEDSKTTLKNVIPEGALHARKHNMENAEELTKKGIPVVDDDNQLQAEIERNELILTLEVTKKLEELYNDGSDEAAIEAGKLLVYEILENTDDRTGLIAKCENGGVINGAK